MVLKKVPQELFWEGSWPSSSVSSQLYFSETPEVPVLVKLSAGDQGATVRVRRVQREGRAPRRGAGLPDVPVSELHCFSLRLLRNGTDCARGMSCLERKGCERYL